jgi:Tol biopolymer transport system component
MKIVTMKKLSLFLFIIIISFITNSCRKVDGPCFDDLPNPPYLSPVWHPNGQILGFNRLPLKTIYNSDKACSGYVYTYYEDSTGFWLINKDGTNLRRATTFQLSAPSWSPDGKWIAFCNGGTIYKMLFDGTHFDTSHVIPLTNNGANNNYPSWSLLGDTIYFDSNKSAPSGTSFYAIWKIAADGSGQTRITKELNLGGREPFFINGNQILFTRFVNQFTQVFFMNTKGENVKQITLDTIHFFGFQKEFPLFYDNKLFFENYGIWSINMDGSGLTQLTTPSTQGFSISKDGTVAYINFGYNTLTKELGTVWLMDSAGNNKKQLTYNYIQ